ncbi:MAG: hypothetical protein ACK5XT_14225 [Gemmatimonas sp.]|jgi:hypothetical protein|uniref:hypothetical protein n=1 Tax=Gemmatimonas sp. TaxID=1962908 RepID=UPI00391F3578
MTVTRRRLVHLIGLVTLLGVSGATARAHDLAEASAALVVRDGGHLELRLQVPWAALLQADRMPGRPLPEFLMYVSAMSPSTFDGHYRRLVAQLERAFHLTRPAAAPVTFQRWVWPRSAAVQQAVQRELMSRLADGANAEHAARLPATAEAVVGGGVASVALEVPALLTPLLLTVTRPQAQWVRAGQPAVVVPLGMRR